MLGFTTADLVRQGHGHHPRVRGWAASGETCCSPPGWSREAPPGPGSAHPELSLVSHPAAQPGGQKCRSVRSAPTQTYFSDF